MNSPSKSASHPINTGLMRLELLMRAQEVARQISARVHCALAQDKPVTTSPEPEVAGPPTPSATALESAETKTA